MWIIWLIIGLAAGFGCGLFIVAGKVQKSNDLGNSAGGFNDYASTDIYYVCKEDHVSRSSLDKYIKTYGDTKNWR
ncbi:MAG: hypothetical protein J5685_05035 [Clostridiales bacterium]|nr:hypothetical protein [Clostridiales bacterium]